MPATTTIGGGATDAITATMPTSSLHPIRQCGRGRERGCEADDMNDDQYDQETWVDNSKTKNCQDAANASNPKIHQHRCLQMIANRR